MFITFRLFGTLPVTSGRDGRSFVAADQELEGTTSGPSWLKHPLIAECVTETIRHGEGVRGLYRLAAFVVMPNHVHLLIEPEAPAPTIMQFVKGVSARRANGLLGRTGRPFWQDESFDRWVRSQNERRNIIRYIEFKSGPGESRARAGIISVFERLHRLKPVPPFSGESGPSDILKSTP